MSSRERLLNSLIYPIQKHIRFEIDDIVNFQARQCSDRFKIGKGEWSIKANRLDGIEWGRDLNVELIFFSRMKKVEGHLVFRIINQQKPGQDKIDESGVYSWTTLRWSKLLSDGYVKDGKIIIDCLLRIDSEWRSSIDFGYKRPNEEDLRMILEKKKVPSKQEFFEMEVNVADFREKEHFTDETTVFGLPVRVSFKNNGDLRVRLYFNWKDESEWWMSRIALSVLIVNRNDSSLSINKENQHVYRKSRPSHYTSFGWDELMNVSNGFIRDGKLKVQVFVRLLESYGFDEQTNRGIERPLREMTDVRLRVNGWTFHVSKMILSQQSSYFKDLFASRHNPYEIKIEMENIDGNNFTRFLELVHNVDTDICEENAQSILKVIDRFQAPECFKRCDSVLMRKDFGHQMHILENVMDWVFKYPLPGLQMILLRKIKDDKVFEMNSEQQKKILEWKSIADKLKEEEEEVEKSDGTDFGQKSEFTNVEIKVAGHSYYASKQILSNASYYFMKTFYGPFSNEEAVISDLDVSHSNCELLLTHIYHPTRPVTNVNLDSLLQLAHQFSVPRLMVKCEEYLVLNNFLSLIDKLEYAGKFDLPLLRAACLKAARKDMTKLTSHHKYSLLAPHVVKELSAIQHEDR